MRILRTPKVYLFDECRLQANGQTNPPTPEASETLIVSGSLVP